MTGGATAEGRLRALVTRPRDDAEGISQALEARGYDVRLEPLLDIVLRHGVAVPMDDVQGILATSANGIRAFAANSERRDLPVWAVGNATARCAADLGFAHVESAGGDVESLAALVARRVDAAGGALLHAAGTKLAGDLSGQLTTLGYTVRRVALYEARPANELSPRLIADLDADALDLALFFSPRTAAAFATLIDAAGRSAGCRRVTAFALSAAVARELAILPWRSVHVADRPDQTALIEAIVAAYLPPRSSRD